MYGTEYTRKAVLAEMYILPGAESRLSMALAIGHTVLHPQGKKEDTLSHVALTLNTVPYAGKHLQGCTIMSHQIEQSRTNRSAQTASRKEYRIEF